MRALAALLALLSLTASAQNRFQRFTTRTPMGRTDRGLLAGGAPAFEFAPAGGAGMGTECACAAITSSTGTAVTLSRATNATCTKGANSLRTTGIANGDLVVCSSNLPRVQQNSAGALRLLVENTRTNTCIRSAELCNAAWADVGTPACTSDVTTGPFGTTTMDTITDDDALALEGRSQAITTTSATQHSVGCYVKSVSGVTAASITLVGTGSSTGDCTGTATGLSTTTSTRVTCTSPAAYAGTLTAVTLTIRVGTVVGDTGTVAVEGCDHQVATSALYSHIPTVAASVTRNQDVMTVTGSWPSNPGSMAITVDSLETISALSGTRYPLVVYTNVGNFTSIQTFGQVIAASSVTSFTSALTPASTSARLGAQFDGTNYWACLNGTCTSAARSHAGINANQPTISVGGGGLVASSSIEGLYGLGCVDSSPTRCL